MAFFHSENDRALVQKLLDAFHSGNITFKRPIAGRRERDDQQSPDVYIAKPPGGGIPALVAGTPDVAGKADCDIYQINDNDELVQAPSDFGHEVFNLSTTAVSSNWVFVARSKYGKWIALEVSTQKAEGITFTTTEDMGASYAGQATATINDYYRGYNPAEAGFHVHDPQGLFPRALSGAKGKATYDDRSDEYHITECQQMATACGCLTNAAVASTSATFTVTDVEVMFPIVGQLPTVVNVRNTFSDTLNNAQPLIIGWNETDDVWDVLEVKRAEAPFWVKAQSNWENNTGGEDHPWVSVKRCDAGGDNVAGAAFDIWLPRFGTDSNGNASDPNVVTDDVILAGLVLDGSYSCLSDYLDSQIGEITWFSGAKITGIGPGWALCDGTNDTVNLSGRFIMCVDVSNGLADENEMGDTGGHNWHGETDNNHSDHPNHRHALNSTWSANAKIEVETSETSGKYAYEWANDKNVWTSGVDEIPGAIDEVQTFTFDGTPSAGTFTLKFNVFGSEETTAAIAFGASVADIQTAVDTLLGAGNLTVASDDAEPWTDTEAFTITFDGGEFEGLPQEMVVADSTALVDSTINVTRTQETGHDSIVEHFGDAHDGETAAGNDPHDGDDRDSDNRPSFYVLAAKQRIDNSV